MKQICPHIKAKGKPEETTLYQHLIDVSLTAEKIAHALHFDLETARCGAVLHDIGKTSSVFQARLNSKTIPKTPFRHEIASCFFLSAFPENIHPQLIEMVIAHHKSILHDAKEKGILDLEEVRGDTFNLHIKDWNHWKGDALEILNALGIKAKKEFLPIQPGDVEGTFADVDNLVNDFDFKPTTKIDEGVNKFAFWYKDYFSNEGKK